MMTMRMCVISATLSVMYNGATAQQDVKIEGSCPVLFTTHQP